MEKVDWSEHTTPEYELWHMAQSIAMITSGVPNAEPEEDDYELARQFIHVIETILEKEG